jgi:hypothetical protein
MLLPKEKIRLLSMVDVLEPLTGEELEEFSRRVPDTHIEQGGIFYAPEETASTLYAQKGSGENIQGDARRDGSSP